MLFNLYVKFSIERGIDLHVTRRSCGEKITPNRGESASLERHLDTIDTGESLAVLIMTSHGYAHASVTLSHYHVVETHNGLTILYISQDRGERHSCSHIHRSIRVHIVCRGHETIIQEYDPELGHINRILQLILPWDGILQDRPQILLLELLNIRGHETEFRQWTAHADR